MTEQKHTPGPWWDSGLEVGSTPTMAIKVAKCSGANYPEAHANARLIAAAPELLSVLTELERAVSAKFAHEIGQAVPPGLRDINEQVMKARAVIVKATS